MWVVDPIDGTANFARGVPHFCVSIACVAAGKVEVGVIYNPMLDELFAARRGGGARLNGAPISASRAASLANASVEVGWNSRAGFAQYVDLLRRVASTGASPSRTGSGALAIAYVAAGRSDGFVEHHINAWDCLAGILLVSEAGGYVSDFLKGDGLTKGNALVACAPGVKDALIAAAAFDGLRPMSEIMLDPWRCASDDRAPRRRGETMADRRARFAVARRSGDLERHQSDPLSGRRLDAERRGAGRRAPLPARPARLRPVRDLRRRVLGARLRAA